MATHWHYFFFSSERDRQVCYTIDTRRSNYANIFSYHFPSFYYIRTWQENPQKEILATPKYESKEEEQSGRTKQFKFWPSHVRWRFKQQAFKWNIILCLNVPLMLSFLLFPSCAWFFFFFVFNDTTIFNWHTLPYNNRQIILNTYYHNNTINTYTML